MRHLRTSVVVLALTLIAALSAVAAGAQSAQMSTDTKTVQGQLVKVDADNQVFTIKQENGEEVQFHYDTNTEVQGSQTTVQGLASETGTRVSVQYTESDNKKHAQRIEIQKSDR